MKKTKNPFVYAEGKRIKITSEQEKEIRKLYKTTANELLRQIGVLNLKSDSNSSLKLVYLNNIKTDLENKMKSIDGKTEKLISSNVDNMVGTVMENNVKFLTDFGFRDFRYNPNLRQDMAERVITGQLYENRWNLSSSIWGDDRQKINEINRIVSKGILKNKSVYDIAKDLQRYVNPDAKKDWKWSIENHGVRKKIDYNAQRLARTMISHAYQEAFVRMTINNPFVEAYQWITSGTDKVCALCIEREEDDKFGLGPGIFPKDQLPLDHPNGMCTFDIVTPYTDSEIRSAVDDWYFNEGDEFMNMELDYFMEDLM